MARAFGAGYGVGEREYGERQGQRREAEELRVQVVGGISEIRDAERLQHASRNMSWPSCSALPSMAVNEATMAAP